MRLLANPRYFGVGFNPVSFYFLHDENGVSVDAVIAEVTNTPWGERTTYVLDGRSREHDGAIRGRFDKRMHVSPFQPMDQAYEISVAEPGEQLRVTIRNLDAGREVFTATMALRRHELTRAPDGGPARPLSADDACDAGPHLRQRAEAEAQGRALPPPPAIAGEL